MTEITHAQLGSKIDALSEDLHEMKEDMRSLRDETVHMMIQSANSQLLIASAQTSISELRQKTDTMSADMNKRDGRETITGQILQRVGAFVLALGALIAGVLMWMGKV